MTPRYTLAEIEIILGSEAAVEAPAIPQSETSSDFATVLAELRRITSVDNRDGSKRLLAYACRCVEHNQSDNTAIALIREIERQRPFPREYSDDEIRQRLRDAEKKTARGSEVDDGRDDPFRTRKPAKRRPARKIDPSTEAEKIRRAHPTLKYWRGDFLEWRGGCYPSIGADAIQSIVVRHLSRDYHGVGGGPVSNTLMHLKAVTELDSTIEPGSYLGDDVFPADETLATATQLVHIPTRNVVPATSKFFTLSALDYRFDPLAAKPEKFLGFVNQICRGDQESIDVLQEWFGINLTQDTSHQKALLIIGPKRAGKGVVARVARALVGPANVAAPTLASFSQNFGLASLLGKTLAIISDARLSSRADQQALVERLLSITGEDALTIDRKFREPCTCKLYSRLMFLSNEMPRLTDASGALASRLIVVRLPESFYGREDPHLTERLLAELPGILLWAMDGWQRLHDRGRFVQPASGREIVEQITELGSPVTEFVRDCCLIDCKATTSIRELFAAWRDWCYAAGRQNPGNDAAFSRDLSAACPSLRRHRPRGSGRGTVIEGLRLVSGTGGTSTGPL